MTSDGCLTTVPTLPPTNVLWVLAALLAVLVIGSIVRVGWYFFVAGRSPEKPLRLKSLITWWVFFVLVLAVAFLGKEVAIVLFACFSLLGLHEYSRLAQKRIAARRLWWLAFLAVPIHYLIVWFGWFGPFWTFIPVWVFCILLVRMVITGETHAFLETAGIAFLGLMLIVFLFSHAVLFLSLPAEVNPAGGTVGLFLYLVVLTEVNDISQALWGRRLGRHKITPTVSPGKTWEGFLLGAATTVCLAVALAKFLTPFADRPLSVGSVHLSLPYVPAVLAGLLIAVGGFFGDVTISAIKREVGVKDSGTLLPGQGGMLDRMDSLTFTAPLFFYFFYVLYVENR